MAINAAPSTLRRILKLSPQWVADTLAELQSSPDSYAGEYVLCSDQPAGQQVYFVEEDLDGNFNVLPAYEMDGYKAEEAGDDLYTRRYDANGDEIVGSTFATQFLSGTVAGGQGLVSLNATVDGTPGGDALFSSILSVSLVVNEVNASLQNQQVVTGYEITNGKNISARVVRGNSTSILLGGTVTSFRLAPNGTAVTGRVEGILA